MIQRLHAAWAWTRAARSPDRDERQGAACSNLRGILTVVQTVAQESEGEATGDDQERIRANYRGNYARLVDVKRRYDADNLFRVNQNIKP